MSKKEKLPEPKIFPEHEVFPEEHHPTRVIDTSRSYRYSDEDLLDFKKCIERKIQTATDELNYLNGVINRKDEAGTDDTYIGFKQTEEDNSFEREKYTQLANRQVAFIERLEEALIRIENKTYGVCRETGKLIDKARLRAVPHTTLSIEAKNAKNAQKN